MPHEGGIFWMCSEGGNKNCTCDSKFSCKQYEWFLDHHFENIWGNSAANCVLSTTNCLTTNSHFGDNYLRLSYFLILN